MEDFNSSDVYYPDFMFQCKFRQLNDSSAMVRKARARISASRDSVTCLDVSKLLSARGSADYELTLSTNIGGGQSVVVSVREMVEITEVSPSLIYLQSRLDRHDKLDFELQGRFEAMKELWTEQESRFVIELVTSTDIDGLSSPSENPVPL